MDNLIKDKDFLKWLIKEGGMFVIVCAFVGCTAYLGFTYTPRFVDSVGDLADSTNRIDMHLGTMVEETRSIEKKVESIQTIVLDNNRLLKLRNR